MMFVRFLSLLLCTGGNTEQPLLRDDHQVSNQSFVEMTGGNLSRSEQPKLNDDQRAFTVEELRVNDNCSYKALLEYLNLNKNNELYTLSRPVKRPTRPTRVNLKMVLYSILEVREIDQTFIPYVWVYMAWMNDHIHWDPAHFCGLRHIIVPTELLWKPDLTIEEMTEKDKAPPSPFLTINYDGEVELRNDQVLISTCRMQVYKFPFDTQKCNLSFKSIVHSCEEIKLLAIQNSTKITEWSLKVMGKQYEWDLINMTAISETVNNFEFNQSMIVYTIFMKRRSELYIVNFILPILCFLCLDFASFLISDSGGEKLSFKVTVLLAVTVMQLILNEILPSSSDRIPLVAVYCIGTFALMLLSLMETIVVMHLLGKDSESQESEADNHPSLSEDCADRRCRNNFNNGFREISKGTCCKCVCDADETPANMLPEEVSSSQLTEVSRALEKVSGDLREMEKTMSLIRNSSSSTKEERRPGYWTRMTKRINKVFFICYFTAAVLFLMCMFSLWIIAEDN